MIAVLTKQLGISSYRQGWRYLSALKIPGIALPPHRVADAKWLRLLQEEPDLAAGLERTVVSAGESTLAA